MFVAITKSEYLNTCNTPLSCMSYNATEQSDFNMAVSFLNRLNYHFLMLDEAVSENNLSKMATALFILFKEISDDLPEEEYKRKYKEIINIRKVVEQYTSMVSESGERVLFPDKYRTQLDDFEYFIRLVVKKKGYKMRYQEDAHFSLK